MKIEYWLNIIFFPWETSSCYRAKTTYRLASYIQLKNWIYNVCTPISEFYSRLAALCFQMKPLKNKINEERE